MVESGGQEAADEPFSAALRLHTLLTDLRKQSQRTEDSAERRVARRVLDGVFISLYEQGVDFLRVRRLYARAVRTFSLATEVAPDRNSTFYYLAWAHAAAAIGRRRCIALHGRIEQGFADLEAITATAPSMTFVPTRSSGAPSRPYGTNDRHRLDAVPVVTVRRV